MKKKRKKRKKEKSSTRLQKIGSNRKPEVMNNNIRVVSQLSTGDFGAAISEGVVADSAPSIVVFDLQSTLPGIIPINKSYI